MRRPIFALAILATLVSVSADAAIPDRERAALLNIFNTMNGPNWQHKENWGGPPGTECQWWGITCDNDGVTVVEVVLGYNGLSGTIPRSIADLMNVEWLHFVDNSLTGTIPAEIGTMQKLKVLQLAQNALSGPLPSSLSNLASLEQLEIQLNKLSGPIPPELGRLTKLKVLALDENEFSGGVPRELGQLTELTNLQLDYNSLSGPLPAEIGNLTKLESLSFVENSISGNLPVEITNLRQLKTLLAFDNKLTGPIPDPIGNLSQLTDFEIYGNEMSGPIPQSLYTIAPLQTLGLARNHFVGTINGFTRLPNLIDLYLDGNQFSGPIPPEITSLKDLEVLALDGNQLTGPIPADIDRLTHLRVLDLGANHIGGTIPAALGNLSALEYLGLYEDELSGTIPPQLASATKLQQFVADGNALTGTIPDSFRALKELDWLRVSSNQLTGPLPNWLPDLPKLTGLLVDSNQFTGTLPANITSLANLDYLDAGANQLSGPIPSDIGKLQKLQYISLENNEFSGPIPDSFWTLTQLTGIRLGGLHLTGTLPPAIGNLTKVDLFDVRDNDMSGVIPPQIANLQVMRYLDIGMNRFTGTLPREFGQMKTLQSIDFGANNFRSPIPPELMQMAGMIDEATDFAYNSFSTSDPALIAFMNKKQFDHDFQHSQTITPANLRVTATTDRSAVVEWTPIAYQYDEGGYRVFASLTQGGAAVAIATTSTKEISSITVRGLQPSTTYFFTVAAVTHPHDFQRNLIVSDVSSPVSAMTGPRQLAPADVVVTATPVGLVQLDGVPQNEDSFTLTNFGDVATNITIGYDTTDFYVMSPAQFTLAGGASQSIRITQKPNWPAGVHYGGAIPQGDGTSEENIITTTLLSASRAGGTAIAEPLVNRVEVSGDPGSDSVGQVSFRNRGTARLTGVLVADVPWLVPNNEAVVIDPGSTVLVRFKVVRARRPAGVALTGTLSLIYVGALPEGATTVHVDDTSPLAGVSISKVTVVDTSKPEVGSANAPQIAAGEVAYFIAGLTSRNSGGAALVSDLRIVNAFASKPANDIRLFYSSSTVNAVANLSTLASSQAVTLANIASSVYGQNDQLGSLQVRSASWQNLSVNATLLRLINGAGTFAGDMPVFRSDRALKINEKAFLTGIRQSSSVHASVYLEEIAGNAANILVAFVDDSGNPSPAREVRMPAYATTEVTEIPANTATIVVTNASLAPPSAILAYARMSDDASGDTWSVVDWSRHFDYYRYEPVRIPVIQGGASGGGKRRAVAHDTAPRMTTSVTFYNPAASDARATLTAGSIAKDVTIPARQTLTINDAGSFMGMTSLQSLVVETSLKSEIAVTSRVSSVNAAGGSIGTAIPVVPSRSGLRVGQGQIFAGLEDSSAYRTDYGFVETSGAKTVIRATLLVSDARSLFTAVVSRDFAIDANGFVFVNDLVKSILGSARSQYGDLHDLQLQLEVTEGNGSVLPFVVLTNTASGDQTLRLE